MFDSAAASKTSTIEGRARLPLRHAAAALHAAVAAQRDAPPATSTSILRVERALSATDPLAWLAAQPEPVRLAWCNRSGELQLAGCGTALTVEGADFDCLRRLPRGGTAGSHADLRYLATARFRTDREASDEWRPFGVVRAYLPRIEMRRAKHACHLAVHLRVGARSWHSEIDSALRAIERLRLPITAPTPHPIWVEQEEPESWWSPAVDATLAEIDRARVAKVVLARTRRLRADAAPCAVDLLRALAAEHPATYRFCVQVDGSHAFFGASPERLYLRVDRDVWSEAMAGTRPRGASPEADRELADQLRNSTKDGLEHALVGEHVCSVLEHWAERVQRLGADVVPLTNVQHLRTEFRARLSGPVEDATLIGALHPTPAVCGLPTGAAFEQIERRERFDRGLYCGPIGCLGPTGAEWAVAIRSALLRDRDVRLYAGAGIVAGSRAASEWRETESKLRAFAPLLHRAP